MLGYDRASEFARLLRPGWWVLRGYVLAMIFLQVFVPGPFGMLPQPDGYAWIWFAAVAVGVFASVRLAKVSQDWRGWLARLVLAGNGVLALVMLAEAANYGGLVMFTEPVYVYESPNSTVNVYPYDRNGQPLRDARLIDEWGNDVPIGGYRYCEDIPEPAQPGYPPPPCVQPFPYPSIPPVPDASGFPTPTPTPTPPQPPPPAPVPSLSVTPIPSPSS
jgi:hypothetical protein